MKPLPRATRIVTAVAALGFLALLICGPLLEATLPEKLFALALLASVVVLVMFATRRPAFALALPTILFGGILVASALKFHYLTAPLLAPDLIYFLNRDLIDVATRYPPIMFSLIAGAILIPGLLYLVWRLDRPRFLGHLEGRRRHWVRGAGAISAALLVVAIDSPPGPFSEVFEKGMWQTMNDQSYVTDFFTSFYQTEIKIPPRVANAKVLTWIQPDGENPPRCATARCQDSAGKTAQVHPDIVSVLEESTFDPTLLEVCKLPLCKHKLFVPDGRTRAHGFLTIHVWGGGTWTSEFALLTGLDHQMFGDAGLYAPYNLAPRVVHTLPRLLHDDAGYRTIAIYPMSGDFINARNAYKAYGFDKFYDGQDYGLSWESSDNDLMQVFDRIYAEEKKAYGDKPLFIMLLTLRQHGPHSTPLKELPAPYDKPLFPGKWKPKGLDEWMNLNLGNYLQRLDGSDAAMTHLEKTLLDGDRPTLLFHFGDHQPSFDGAIRELHKIVPKAVTDPNYVTYYMLKTNFNPARSYDYPVFDLSFGGALILDIAGVRKDEFFEANALMRERCNGFYLNCGDKALLDAYQNYIFHDLGVLHE